MSNWLAREPAFPSHGTMGEVTHTGLSKREYFAAMAALAPLRADCIAAMAAYSRFVRPIN